MKMKTLFLIFCFCLSAFAQKQSIDSAEYFIGNDPGEGKGTPLNLSTLGDATVPMSDSQLPPLGPRLSTYVRVKGSGFINNVGSQVPGVWSLPVCVSHPVKNLLMRAAQARIVRPGLGFPIWETVVAADGSFDNIIETILVTIRRDSVMAGDTLQVRLQNSADLWGLWCSIAITPDMLTGVVNGQNFCSSIAASLAITSSGLLRFIIAKPSTVSIEIFNLRGNKTIIAAKNNFYNIGRYSVDLRKFNFGAGTYLCRFTANGIKQTIKLEMLR